MLGSGGIMTRLALIIWFLWLVPATGPVAQTAQDEARIGVLAYRGAHELERDWSGLRDYLDRAVSGWTFEIVPVTLSSADAQITMGELDFLITNPGHFATLNSTHRMSVIATRLQQKSDGSFSNTFGSAIIVRADSTISTLQDAAGKTVVAVDPNAFGGFQLAWSQFQHVGLDVFRDTAALNFVGFPMDQVVTQVLTGAADVGIVRSGLIERLVAEGRIGAQDFRVLNASASYAHPDALSTDLYPEWPFAALATAPAGLKDRVAIALLTLGDSPIAQDIGIKDRWSAPAPYHSAIALTAGYAGRASPTNIWIYGLLLSLTLIVLIGLRRRPARTFSVADPSQGAISADALEQKAHLTDRERQVLDLVAKGLSTKEIAINLHVSPKTVEFHRANLLKKFNARSSIELVGMIT